MSFNTRSMMVMMSHHVSSGIRCKCLVCKIPTKGTQAPCAYRRSQPGPVPCAGSSFRERLQKVNLTFAFNLRVHFPTWMTSHGTLTAQSGQIWIHQMRTNARWNFGLGSKNKSWLSVFFSGVVTCIRCSFRKRLRSQSEKNPSIRI